MGRIPRRKQRRVGEKLRQIRHAFDLSQNEILRRTGLAEEVTRNNISNYELDEREPPLFVLLRYARLAGVCLDVIVDDDLDLPRRLPSSPVHR
jgi:transcriptional regulator with XRE-family HTH domain